MARRPASSSRSDTRPEPASSRRKRKSDFSDTATVLVGKHKTAFSVHTAIICRQSPFFKAALEGNWIESEQQTVKLPEDDPDTFSDFLKWLYSGTVDPPVAATSNETRLDISPHINLYVLAEKLQTPDCKQKVLSVLWNFANRIKHIPVDVVVTAWDGTTAHDGLRPFLRDWFMINATMEDITADLIIKAPLCVAYILDKFIRLRDCGNRKHVFRALSGYTGATLNSADSVRATNGEASGTVIRRGS
ncbi:hypothetical protein K461DRAFT_294761 [Myriangium duriaei CBS 260.36]|uniref:BTB domain-containing protein n=1 Tax=Myriangium duriaei CBS 260.36 TaxID=1168546 RepID=A0A9P4MG89_9PEZI|nr:hypothetical protein K461DRAFT_294761 [Myriangium duriaei CBS 260.36]